MKRDRELKLAVSVGFAWIKWKKTKNREKILLPPVSVSVFFLFSSPSSFLLPPPPHFFPHPLPPLSPNPVRSQSQFEVQWPDWFIDVLKTWILCENLTPLWLRCYKSYLDNVCLVIKRRQTKFKCHVKKMLLENANKPTTHAHTYTCFRRDEKTETYSF